MENPLFLKWIPAAVSACTRWLSDGLDALVFGLRRTLFRPRKIQDYGLSLSEKADLALGETLDRVAPGKDHAAALISAKKEADKVSHYLSRSVSFGLLLMMLGLLTVLVWLLAAGRPAA